MSFIIFADGSSLGNPGSGGWAAIVAGFGKVFELGGHAPHTTNNKMELSACIHALKKIPKGSHATVYTDSRYVINGVTSWIHGWKKNNWKTSAKADVLNKELWEDLDVLVQERTVTFHYVPGHSGVPGNERVDEIARSYAEKNTPHLFSGTEDQYPVSLVYKPHETKKVSSKAKPYAYISFVDGAFEEYRTWEACEKSVRGKKQAKFKKVFSQEELEETKKMWMKG